MSILGKLIIGLITSIAVFVLLISYATNRIQSDIQESKEYVGKKVILNGDTSMILDYDVFSDSYTLDNGKTVDAELVKKKTVDK